MDPDYEALARAWVAGDPRSSGQARQDPEWASRVAARMAEALEKRRREVAPSEAEGDLVVHVDRSRFTGAGLDTEALEQLAHYIQEVAEEDLGEPGEPSGP